MVHHAPKPPRVHVTPIARALAPTVLLALATTCGAACGSSVDTASGTATTATGATSSATGTGAAGGGQGGAATGAGGGAAGGGQGGATTGTGGAGGGAAGGGQGGAGPVGPCTSGKLWTDPNQASANMTPGRACIACHAQNPESPHFSVAGTVYPTLHEPDDCMAPPASGATVVVTGADAVEISMPVRSTGNFFSSAHVAAPFTAKITYQGKERAAQHPHTEGDCNVCHSATGSSGAPGRLLLP